MGWFTRNEVEALNAKKEKEAVFRVRLIAKDGKVLGEWLANDSDLEWDSTENYVQGVTPAGKEFVVLPGENSVTVEEI